MDQEDTTNLVEGDDTAVDTATEADDAGVDEPEQFDDDGNPIVPDDDEEFELDGDLKIRVPKTAAEKLRELKEGGLRQADYTRKTQEVAEQRKVFEAERGQFHQATQAEIGALAQVTAIDQQLAEYGQIDWTAWAQQAAGNPDETARMQAAFMEAQQLKDARGNAVGQLSHLRNQRLSLAQQETAKRVEEGRQVLQRDIPEWSPQHAEALLKTGVEQYGFARAEIESFEDPRMVKVLHDAHQWRQSQAKNNKAQVNKQAQEVKLAATVARNSAPTTALSDKAPVDAWMKARNKQAAGK